MDTALVSDKVEVTYIMNVWMSWCKRQATCKYCNRIIEVATPNVVCRSWYNNKKHEKHYHTQCWVDQGLDALRNNPYCPGNRGRKKLPLSSEDTTRRKQILRKYAMLNQQKKRLKVTYPDNVLLVLRLNKKIQNLAKEIEDYGGVPKKWGL